MVFKLSSELVDVANGSNDALGRLSISVISSTVLWEGIYPTIPTGENRPFNKGYLHIYMHVLRYKQREMAENKSFQDLATLPHPDIQMMRSFPPFQNVRTT
ncbi:hypothetical protein D8674_004782 [Pyrus ussuriensis x Pyrus communis]|uniref:Uncharacterized protein n=1 Tax=Pyrus ussuriensis x Pyrus communis TaxID=2448454 RepID=A0A5N5FPQ1_9ROSA|nr:hypothetical protein D8674_004782 [Pyrus ussuriensis x Pyrus communis]